MEPSAAQPTTEALPSVLLRVSSELSRVLNGIRVTRETIQTYSTERLRDTHARLHEVSSTSESAAMEMLNGLDRTLGMIDELERSREASPAHAMFDALRTEVNQLYSHLQFQDIIAQQLNGVAGVLIEVERRVQTVATLFEEALGGNRADLRAGTGVVLDPSSYNPDASMHGAPDRQALIDEAFRSARSG
jgi:chemotaxis regulatin CheY-phosphate phosphatase CheZ